MNIYLLFMQSRRLLKMLQNGNAVAEKRILESDRVRMYTNTGVFVGIYEWQEEKGLYKPVAIFSSPEDFLLKKGIKREGAAYVFIQQKFRAWKKESEVQ